MDETPTEKKYSALSFSFSLHGVHVACTRGKSMQSCQHKVLYPSIPVQVHVQAANIPCRAFLVDFVFLVQPMQGCLS